MMSKLILLLGLTWQAFLLADALNNGVAPTPPMGWLTWERFRCDTDCKNDPENCISEHLIKVMADHLVNDGYLAAGYEYITIDDCWLAKERDINGTLQPDPERFPSGIKALADYVHAKGLKFGIYEDFGVKTCAGYPGSEFYMQTDAQTFAEWGVDLLKFDGCNSDYKDAIFGYPAMAMYLKMAGDKTGRPILYGCEWPMYDYAHRVKSNYTAISETCNFWRNYIDISDSWDSVRTIIQYYGANPQNFSDEVRPGSWNDPDQLIIGDYSLSYDQQKTQMAMWTMFAAPLIMSVDLRTMPIESKAILLNKRMIAVSQDKLVRAGQLKFKEGSSLYTWVRPISPLGSAAIVFLNLADGGGPSKMNTTLFKLGLTNESGYDLTEVFDGINYGIYKPMDSFAFFVNPSGVFMITAIIT